MNFTLWKQEVLHMSNQHLHLSKFIAKILLSLWQTSESCSCWRKRWKQRRTQGRFRGRARHISGPIRWDSWYIVRSAKTNYSAEARRTLINDGAVGSSSRSWGNSQAKCHLDICPSHPAQLGPETLEGREAGDPSSSQVEGLERKMSKCGLVFKLAAGDTKFVWKSDGRRKFGLWEDLDLKDNFGKKRKTSSRY